jgi:hypothetical protein
MTFRLLAGLAALLLLPACIPPQTGPEGAVPPVADWRPIATEHDRARLRDWRDAWVEALADARAAGHGALVAAEGPLLDPDSAVRGAEPPAGDYRCRTIKVGGQSEGMLDFVAYPFFDCRIGAAEPEEGPMDFVKLSGSQRPVGRLFPDGPRRMVFIGTLQLGDEQGTLRYGHDRERDMIGLLERIGERRWRLVFPRPAYESKIDVIELLPKE